MDVVPLIDLIIMMFLDDSDLTLGHGLPLVIIISKQHGSLDKQQFMIYFTPWNLTPV